MRLTEREAKESRKAESAGAEGLTTIEILLKMK